MNNNDPKIIFLVWAPFSVRAQNLSDKLNANHYMLNYKFKKKIYSPIKYPILFVKSLRILIKEKPDIAFSQVPPIFCITPILIYNSFFAGRKRKCMIIIDAHTAAFGKPWSYVKSLNKLFLKKSDLLIVTNKELQNKISQDYDISAIVLEDRISSQNSLSHVNNSNKEKEIVQDSHIMPKIAFICSFAPDEPLENILKVASLSPEIKFYITGDHSLLQNKNQILEKKADNLIFTGFMSYNEYISLLNYVDAIVVLTTRDQTMLSGACEAMMVGKPLIVSNWNSLRQYYNKGTICTNNSTEEIREAINTAIAKKEQLTKEMIELKDQRLKEWEESFASLKDQMLRKYNNEVLQIK